MSINRQLLIETFEMNRSALSIPDSPFGVLYMCTCDDKEAFAGCFSPIRLRTYDHLKENAVVVLRERAGGGGSIVFTEKSIFLFWAFGMIVREVLYTEVSWGENRLMFGTVPCPIGSVNEYVLRSIIEKVVEESKNI